jgi:hypothetical protein
MPLNRRPYPPHLRQIHSHPYDQILPLQGHDSSCPSSLLRASIPNCLTRTL